MDAVLSNIDVAALTPPAFIGTGSGWGSVEAARSNMDAAPLTPPVALMALSSGSAGEGGGGVTHVICFTFSLKETQKFECSTQGRDTQKGKLMIK